MSVLVNFCRAQLTLSNLAGFRQGLVAGQWNLRSVPIKFPPDKDAVGNGNFIRQFFGAIVGRGTGLARKCLSPKGG